MIKETAQIIAAYVSGNQVADWELPEVIRSTHAALLSLSQPGAASGQAEVGPAVSLKKSVTADAITCLECGKKLSMLKRHLRAEHHATIEEYRAKWRLPVGYPTVSANYSALRSTLATKAGLGQRRTNVVPTKRGSTRGG